VFSFFRKNHRFLQFDDTELEYVVSLCKIEEFKKDEIIVEEGALGDKIYFLMEGSIGISKKIGERSVFFIATLNIGEIFGEMSVLTNYPRSATAYASEPSKVVNLRKDNFLKMRDERPDVFYKMSTLLTTIIAERLYKMEERVTNILSASLSENVLS